MNRRGALSLLAAGGLAALAPARAAPPAPPVEVFKSPTCGCCGAWVEHLQAAGFAVTVKTVGNTTGVRRRLGLPDAFASCHTATVGGYVLEGHVPAADVKQLLARRPVALGLAVPGMPQGSPGMETPDGQRDAYDVLLIDKQGKAAVFAHHPKA